MFRFLVEIATFDHVVNSACFLFFSFFLRINLCWCFDISPPNVVTSSITVDPHGMCHVLCSVGNEHFDVRLFCTCPLEPDLPGKFHWAHRLSLICRGFML